MAGLVDIHSHILPGIDDGPGEMAASVAMARAAAQAGFETVVATPHLRSDFPNVKVDEIAGRCEELQAAIAAEGIELEIVTGGEVSLSWGLEADDSTLKRASYGQRGTDLLVETPVMGGAMMPALLTQLAARGYRIVLAHPERLSDFQTDPDLLGELAHWGIALQVNADGILGSSRRSPSARLAQQLLGRGQISVIASDGHRGSDWRPITRLAEARTLIARTIDPEAAAQLTEIGPRSVITGERLAPMLPSQAQGERKRWPSFGFRR